MIGTSDLMETASEGGIEASTIDRPCKGKRIEWLTLNYEEEIIGENPSEVVGGRKR